MPVVNVLEDRFNSVLMHWFLFVVSGLSDISSMPKPILFHTPITETFQRESLELLKPDYEYVENTSGHSIIQRHGAPCIDLCHVPDHYYHFVRNTILVKNGLENTAAPTRRIYISRSKSHLLTINNGHKKRQMIGEGELIDTLKEHGFECIHLEDYSLQDKIRLFQEAKIVVSPNGGAFTMCFFANRASTMLFIRNQGTTETQYSHICEVLSIPIVYYEKVRCLNVNGNETKGDFGEDFSMEVLDREDLVRTIQPYL